MADFAGRPPNHARLFWFIVPLFALFAAAAWLISSDWLRGFQTQGVPPVEKVTFERKNEAEFLAELMRSVEASKVLHEAARGHDRERSEAALRLLMTTCVECHRDYRD